MMDLLSHLSPEARTKYLDKAVPRLEKIDELSKHCRHDKWPSERTPREKEVIELWEALMAIQEDDEINAGL